MKSWDDWKHVHQPYELNYHTYQGVAWCSDEEKFKEFWDRVFDFIPDRDKRYSYLDIGCGPRPPMLRFAPQAQVYCIEPLADDYRKIAPKAWWEGLKAYSMPAEVFVYDLKGRIDLVMSWNCLDHTIGWKQILQNAHDYMGSIDRFPPLFVVATDFKPVTIGHPGFSREEFMEEIGRLFDIVKKEDGFMERDIALVLTKKT